MTTLLPGTPCDITPAFPPMSAKRGVILSVADGVFSVAVEGFSFPLDFEASELAPDATAMRRAALVHRELAHRGIRDHAGYLRRHYGVERARMLSRQQIDSILTESYA